MLIKGSANRGAINQRLDHSYSHPTDDDGCDVVFIQLLARCLRQRPLLLSWLSNGNTQREKEKIGNVIHVLVLCYFNSLYSYMLTKLQPTMSQPCLYSRHTYKQNVHVIYTQEKSFGIFLCTAASNEKTYSSLCSGKVGKSKTGISAHPRQ